MYINIISFLRRILYNKILNYSKYTYNEDDFSELYKSYI